MKKLLLSMTAVLAFGFVNAQIYSASDSVAFSAWTPYDNDGDSENWFNLDYTGAGISTACDAQGETISSLSWNNAPLTPDNLLVSPLINCSSSATIYLNWKAFSPEGGTSTYFAEKYSVYVVTQAQLGQIIATGVYPSPVHTETLTAGAVVFNRSVNVSTIAGSQSSVYVVFRHYDCTDMFILSIDDVSVTTASTASIAEQASIEVSAYPNPAYSILNINTTTDAQSISIYAMDGKVVATAEMSGLEGSIDVADLVDGIYFYEVTASNGTVVRKTFAKK